MASTWSGTSGDERAVGTDPLRPSRARVMAVTAVGWPSQRAMASTRMPRAMTFWPLNSRRQRQWSPGSPGALLSQCGPGVADPPDGSLAEEPGDRPVGPQRERCGDDHRHDLRVGPRGAQHRPRVVARWRPSAPRSGRACRPRGRRSRSGRGDTATPRRGRRRSPGRPRAPASRRWRAGSRARPRPVRRTPGPDWRRPRSRRRRWRGSAARAPRGRSVRPRRSRS